jgi:uncharacterized protein (DUF4415 family)
LKKVDRRKPVASDYNDAPELTDEQLAKAKRGRPATGHTKTLVSLRLDNDLLAAYRSTGEGWQSRINADLRKARRRDI